MFAKTAKIFGKMTKICGKCLKYVDKWESFENRLNYVEKWLRDLTNGLNCVRNDVYTWGIGLTVLEKRPKYVGNDVRICGTDGSNIWEMTYIFGNWLNYLTNGLKHVKNDLEICGKWLKICGGNRLRYMGQTA